MAKTVHSTDTARPPTRRAAWLAAASPEAVGLLLPLRERRARSLRSATPNRSSERDPRQDRAHARVERVARRAARARVSQQRGAEGGDHGQPGPEGRVEDGTERPACSGRWTRERAAARPGRARRSRRPAPARTEAQAEREEDEPSAAQASVMPWRPSWTGMARVRNAAARPRATRTSRWSRSGLDAARPGRGRGRAPPGRRAGPSSAGRVVSRTRVEERTT